MKSYSIKVLIVSLMVSGIAAITSCKDDNLIDPSTNTPPLLEKEMKISRINHFYKIDIPGESEWHVTHSPKWIGLLNRKGSAGERLQLFVQRSFQLNPITVLVSKCQLHITVCIIYHRLKYIPKFLECRYCSIYSFTAYPI